MDRKELREDYIELGKKVLEGLNSDFAVTSAFWFLLPDSGWRFVVATPVLDRDGPAKAYETLQTKLSAILGTDNSFINNVSVVSPSNSLIKLLKSAINTGPDSISGIRFTGNVINSQYIEGAYIYRIS
ncbi:MAG TPA: hypothetical protein VK674_01140 [Candidatus Limnocylindria bacterium]|nr:hypothetical protein [Candidatus Limnocylindria bacterium]